MTTKSLVEGGIPGTFTDNNFEIQSDNDEEKGPVSGGSCQLV